MATIDITPDVLNAAPNQYCIDTDDEGENCLFVTAIVKNHTVSLDWVRPDDTMPDMSKDYTTMPLEELPNHYGMRFMKEFGNEPLKSGEALFMTRLHKKGRVSKRLAICLGAGDHNADKTEENRLWKLAEEAILNIYDDVFPEVAEEAEKFVEEMVQAVKAVDKHAFEGMKSSTGAQPLPENPDGILATLLDAQKEELVEDGDFTQKIGWVVNGQFLCWPTEVPYFKYRWGKAVAEVAKRVTAEAVIYLADGYVLDNGGNRTGTEVLQTIYINPDGSCSAKVAHYTRRKHPHVRRDIIDFLPEEPDHEPTQRKDSQSMIPAWGTYITN